VSAREWRAVREGETHTATKTSSNNTQESFIVGIGASGALLAGAAIVFVTLVGLVSFNVWPTGHEVSVDGNVELSTAKLNASPASGKVAPVSAASGQLASTSVGAGSSVGGGGSGAGGSSGGGANDQGGGNGGQPKSGFKNPPATSTPPPAIDVSGGTGNAGDTGQTPPETASKSPAHSVHPSHPDTPHQNISTGTKGKEDGSVDNGADDVVTGKGPFTKPTPPTPPSASDPSTDSTTTLHGSSKPKHH
jgi:hypothetical protein